MSDLEQRLRDYADAGSEIAGAADDMFQAADRLRQYREALADLLGQVEQAREGFGIYAKSESMDRAVSNARTALKETTDVD